MRTSRLVPALLTVLLLAFGAAACGDDDDDPAVAADASDAADAAEEEAPGGAAITIAGFAFDPETTEVDAGTTVTVTNDDSAAHTWTADDGAFDSGQLAGGDEFEHTFADAGTFAFHCEIHPAMTGTVTVG